ncbi:RidA family protein [Spirosoma panaciterrae]|uniref:RidA family protein n=1 Tax=Spirosoma panaciterrae TaxID=496058 RepID=UPI00035F2441|nr:RidA family protein [Spirosoma panaciterrae]
MNYLRNVLIWLALASCSQAQTPVLPKAPTGYLYKVEPGIPGKTVYVCGQRPFNEAGELVGPGDLTAQTRQVFENIKTSLATVNMTLQDITQITYSVKESTGSTQVSSANAQSVQAVQATYFAQPPKLVEQKGVGQTVRDDVLIEIEVIAVK